MSSISAKTIEDFGAQWTRYTDNEGYYGSTQLLADIIEPLLPLESFKGAKVAEIGSGTGRIVNMLLASGVTSVIALEPSAAHDVLVRNTIEHKDLIEYVRKTGDRLPQRGDLDIVLSIGVLHHIADPSGAVTAAYGALRPGGICLVWLYGYEGNEGYVRLAGLLRKVTTFLPDKLLGILCRILDRVLDLYIIVARRLPLPMRDYFLNHYAKLSRGKRVLTIFDQLNPAYAKYYKKDEAISLLARGGFKNIEVFHRHGYSWTVRGVKA